MCPNKVDIVLIIGLLFAFAILAIQIGGGMINQANDISGIQINIDNSFGSPAPDSAICSESGSYCWTMAASDEPFGGRGIIFVLMLGCIIAFTGIWLIIFPINIDWRTRQIKSLDSQGKIRGLAKTAIFLICIIGIVSAFDALDYDGNWEEILSGSKRSPERLYFPGIEPQLSDAEAARVIYFGGYSPRHTFMSSGKLRGALGIEQRVQMYDSLGPPDWFDKDGVDENALTDLSIVVCSVEIGEDKCLPFMGAENQCNSSGPFLPPWEDLPEGIFCTFDLDDAGCSSFDPYCQQYHYGRLFDGTTYSTDSNFWHPALGTTVFDSNAIVEPEFKYGGLGNSPMEVYSYVKDGNLSIDLNVEWMSSDETGGVAVCDIYWSTTKGAKENIIFQDLNLSNENLEHIKPFGAADMVLDLRWDRYVDNSNYNIAVWDRSGTNRLCIKKTGQNGAVVDWNTSGWSGAGAYSKYVATDDAGYYECNRPWGIGTKGLDGDGSDMNYTIDVWVKPSTQKVHSRIIGKTNGLILQTTLLGKPRTRCFFNNGAWFSAITPLTKLGKVGVWNHVGCSWDGSSDVNQLCVYVNGERTNCTTIANGIMTDNDHNVTIGTWNDGLSNNFFGAYDDVHFYSSTRDGEYILPSEDDWNNYYQGQIAQRYCDDWNATISTRGTTPITERIKAKCSIGWDTQDPNMPNPVGDVNNIFIDVSCNVPTGAPERHERSTKIGITIDNVSPTYDIVLDGNPLLDEDWNAHGGNVLVYGDVNDFLNQYPQKDVNLTVWKTGASAVWGTVGELTQRHGIAHAGIDANIIRICNYSDVNNFAAWDGGICLQDKTNPEDCVAGTLHSDEQAKPTPFEAGIECTNWFEYPFTGQTDHNYLIVVHTDNATNWTFRVVAGGSGWFQRGNVDETKEETVDIAEYTTGGFERIIEFDFFVQGKFSDTDVSQMCRWDDDETLWNDMDNDCTTEVVASGIRSMMCDFGELANNDDYVRHISCQDGALNSDTNTLNFHQTCNWDEGEDWIIDAQCIVSENDVEVDDLYILPFGDLRIVGRYVSVLTMINENIIRITEGGQLGPRKP